MRLKAVTLILGIALSTWLSGLVTMANAQEQKKSEKSSKQKETKIDFEDELVEGELKKPELFYLLQKKQFNFKRLIKLREDFLPEMRRDADEVRRGKGRGKN